MVNEQDKKLASSKEQLDEVKNEMEKMKETKEVDLKMQKKKMRLCVILIEYFKAIFPFCGKPDFLGSVKQVARVRECHTDCKDGVVFLISKVSLATFQ